MRIHQVIRCRSYLVLKPMDKQEPPTSPNTDSEAGIASRWWLYVLQVARLVANGQWDGSVHPWSRTKDLNHRIVRIHHKSLAGVALVEFQHSRIIKLNIFGVPKHQNYQTNKLGTFDVELNELNRDLHESCIPTNAQKCMIVSKAPRQPNKHRAGNQGYCSTQRHLHL